MDSDLALGDYLKIKFSGVWKFFLQDSVIIEGIFGSEKATPKFTTEYNATTSIIYIKNFTQITKSRQIAFYISLRTPLTANNYTVDITAERSHGGLVENYSTVIPINITTGYIK